MLVIFEDGPARGQGLELRRQPTFMRVVKGIDGKWDALDLLEDLPALGDTIYVYEVVEGSIGFVCVRPRSKSYNTINYRHVADFPTEDLEDTERWQEKVYGYALARKRENE